MTYCPRCDGPGRVERDWRGVEVVVCDALNPCGLDVKAALEEHDHLAPLYLDRPLGWPTYRLARGALAEGVS